MPMLNVKVDQVGMAGVEPKIIYIDTNNTVAEITASGYLNNITQKFGIPLTENEMALVSSKTSVGATSTQVGWYDISKSGDDWSLTASETTLPLTENQIFVGNSAGVATDVAMSGDISILASGATAIASDVIINADIKTDAAIAFSKLEVMTSGNILVGSAGNVAAEVTMSGDVAIIASGATTIQAGAVDSSMMNANMLRYAAVTMSAAEFNGAYAAPHLVIAAGGANTLLVVESCQVLMTYVSAQFANGGVSHLQYDSTANGAGIIASSTQAAADWQDAVSTANNYNQGIIKQPFSTAINKGLYFSNITQAFDTGDSTFVIHIWYRQIPSV